MEGERYKNMLFGKERRKCKVEDMAEEIITIKEKSTSLY